MSLEFAVAFHVLFLLPNLNGFHDMKLVCSLQGMIYDNFLTGPSKTALILSFKEWQNIYHHCLVLNDGWKKVLCITPLQSQSTLLCGIIVVPK